jgi:hypothetical protein
MWDMLELTQASQVAKAELLVNAERVDPIEAAVDRVLDEVGPYSITCVVCLTFLGETYLCSGGTAPAFLRLHPCVM